MNPSAKVEHLFPLSPSQIGMWLQSFGSQGAQRFIEQAAWCLEGDLDIAALQQAWQTVMDRHVALRSAILSKGSEPVQAVLRQLPISLAQITVEGDEATALEAAMADERAKGFVLNRPPLIRFVLLRCGPQRHWWLVSFHHIILDGWSLPLLWADASAAYAASGNPSAERLPPVADFRNYIAWLKDRSSEQAEAWWRKQLAGFVAANPLCLPTPAPTPAQEYERQLSSEAGSALALAARSSQVSAAIVVEVLWAILIAGRTASDDVVFGATVSGRPAEVAGVERMVGCFINTMPVRLRVNADATLADTIAQHHVARAEQAEYAYCSAGQIHSWSDVAPSQPLYRSLLVYENVPASAPAASEANPHALRITATRLHGGRTGVPLTLLVSPGARPHLRFIYDPAALSDVADIADLLEAFILNLPQALSQPIATLLASIPPLAYQTEASVNTSAQPYIAPRTRLEHALAAIWEALFKRSPIGVLDDFFALGGHSLMALQLAAQIRQQLGRELPLQALAGEATIAKLASVLEQDGQQVGTSLIPLAQGGAGRPVICIHPLFGHVLCYAALAKQLAKQHPVWGLQAPGLEPDEQPASNWDALVEHHWQMLQSCLGSLGPQPVTLVGYSFGGYIALALASRCVAAGMPQPRLFLLDVPHPSVIPPATRQPNRTVLLHSLFGYSLQLDLAELQRLPEHEVLPYVRQRAIVQHLLPAETSIAQIERLLDVAFQHAQMSPPSVTYPFAVTLLRARLLPDRISAHEDLGWREHVASLEIVWVDGSHETMLDRDYVADLARIVADAENNAK